MTKSYTAWQQIKECIDTLIPAVGKDLNRMKTLECRIRLYESNKKISEEKYGKIKKEIAVCVKRIAEIDKQILLLNQIRRPPRGISPDSLRRKLQKKRKALVLEKHNLEYFEKNL